MVRGLRPVEARIPKERGNPHYEPGARCGLRQRAGLLDARAAFAPTAFPALELRIAAAKRKHGIREALAGSIGRVDADQNRAVGAAFNIPGGWFHTQR